MDIVGGRKFRWLRDRMGGLSQSTQLLAQIKNFILMEEVNVRYLQATVRKQVSMCTVHSIQFTCIPM